MTTNIPHQVVINISLDCQTFERDNMGACAKCTSKKRPTRLISFKALNEEKANELRDKFIQTLWEFINETQTKLYKNT